MPLFFVIFLIFLNISPVFGLDVPISRIADDSSVRIRLRDTWMMDTPRTVLARRPVVENLESGERVQVSVREGREEFMVLISREMMGGRIETEAAGALPRVGQGQYPGYAQGSWMLTRRRDTGAGVLIRIFLRSDENTFIQFSPFNEDKCHLDAVVYGGYVTRAMPVPVAFERLYTMPLSEILRLVDGKFPLRYFDVDPAYYRNTRSFVRQIRERIRPLRFADDGAIDENGNYVLIETLQRQGSAGGLNCSGFTKWLIDGILRPVTGRRLAIPPLKAQFGERGSSFTENWEELDLFFGLDWIRNLAAEANGVLRSSSYRALEEFEVRHDNFSYVSVNREPFSYPGFMPEAGYGIEGLYPLLYTLAIDEPFSFYLAAVNNERDFRRNPQWGTPRLRQFFHVAALVPYFDEYGVFRIAVFESAEETSFNAFRSRYRTDHFVNLVKIPIVTRFEP